MNHPFGKFLALFLSVLLAASFLVSCDETPLPDSGSSSAPLGEIIEEFTDFLPTTGTGFLADDEQAQGALGESYDFAEITYFYFNQLSPKAQAVYRQAYANALEFCPEFSLVEELSSEELARVMEALRYDHPELFWLNNSYQYGYNADGMAVSLILTFDCTAEEYPALQQKFDDAAEEILSAAKAYPSAIEREKFVHDYLIDSCEYIDDADSGQSSYSALVEKRTVCAGYSGAFQYLMNQLGIPCYYCPGVASGGSHAWNIILIDGEGYNVDLTWDDPLQAGDDTGSRRYYNYFNLTDSQIAATHLRDPIAIDLPLCLSEKASFAANFSPDPTDTSLSYYRTAASLGLQEEIIGDLSAFYPLCRDKIIAEEALSADLLMAVADAETVDAIMASINTEEFTDLCLYPAVEAKDLFGYTFSMNLYSEEINDGSHLLIFSYAFEES